MPAATGGMLISSVVPTWLLYTPLPGAGLGAASEGCEDALLWVGGATDRRASGAGGTAELRGPAGGRFEGRRAADDAGTNELRGWSRRASAIALASERGGGRLLLAVRSSRSGGEVLDGRNTSSAPGPFGAKLW